MNSFNLSVNDNYMISAKYHDPELTENAVLKLLNMRDKPTCIIVPDDYASLGVHNAVKTLGVKIPDDISIAGYDGIKFAGVIRPFLTTFKQDTTKIGKKLASLLYRQINSGGIVNEDDRIVVVGGELIEGETVADLNM
jgi:DNA-binding LacI/PurR family transcriptional regulator